MLRSSASLTASAAKAELNVTLWPEHFTPDSYTESIVVETRPLRSKPPCTGSKSVTAMLQQLQLRDDSSASAHTRIHYHLHIRYCNTVSGAVSTRPHSSLDLGS